MIDLRSDTVTRPSAAMRAAMAGAEVGDDQWGDDPTVKRLEGMAAEMLGHEAAVYVPSGIMANQLALRAHTRPGDYVLCGEWCHIQNHENASAAALAGVQLVTFDDSAGSPSVHDVATAVRRPEYHMPGPALLCLEDTHNSAGGRVTPADRLKELRAAGAGLPVHIDGARIFNAAVALGVEVASLAEHADTVSFCLSKGLGAPVGSILVGGAALISEARRWRVAYGGAMRQAGIIAAGGVYALEHNVDRLADDHVRAARLAEGIGAPPPDTNIVIWPVGDRDAHDVVRAMAGDGVLATAYPKPGHIRFVTHLDVDDAGIERAIEVANRRRI